MKLKLYVVIQKSKNLNNHKDKKYLKISSFNKNVVL